MTDRQWLAVFLLYVVLGNWKGYLALFEKNAQEPRQIFPTLVAQLAQEDQQKLNEGIVIRNDRALAQILEGYLS